MLAAVFAPVGEYMGESRSLWDIYQVDALASAVIVLVGVPLVGGLKMKNIGGMIPIGGFWGLISAIQLYRRISEGANVGYGVWLLLAGSILAIIGTFGLAEITVRTELRRR